MVQMSAVTLVISRLGWPGGPSPKLIRVTLAAGFDTLAHGTVHYMAPAFLQSRLPKRGEKERA